MCCSRMLIVIKVIGTGFAGFNILLDSEMC